MLPNRTGAGVRRDIAAALGCRPDEAVDGATLASLGATRGKIDLLWQDLLADGVFVQPAALHGCRTVGDVLDACGVARPPGARPARSASHLRVLQGGRA